MHRADEVGRRYYKCIRCLEVNAMKSREGREDTPDVHIGSYS